MPADVTKPWETCVNPGKSIPVGATTTHYALTWAELTGGKPMAAVDPAQILGLQFDLIWPPVAPTGTGGAAATGDAAATAGSLAAAAAAAELPAAAVAVKRAAVRWRLGGGGSGGALGGGGAGGVRRRGRYPRRQRR